MNRHARIPVVALALGLFGAQGAAHAAPSNKELEAQSAALDSRLSALEARTSQSLVELQQQIETSRQELRTLRGQIEEARHDLDSLKQQQRDLYGDLDRRLLLIENGSGTPASGGAGGASSAPDVMF